MLVSSRALRGRGIPDSEITRKPERPIPGSIRVSSLSLGTGPESVEFPRAVSESGANASERIGSVFKIMCVRARSHALKQQLRSLSLMKGT